MGREVEARAQYQGQTGMVRALLESDALILRGDVRARIARGEIAGWTAEMDDLRLHTADGPLVLTMGGAEAAKWVASLNKPLPTLAHKLGLAGQTVWLLQPFEDASLSAALAGVAPVDVAQATLGIAVLRSPRDLDDLLAVWAAHPVLPVWAINEKGPRAGLPESAIRVAMRAAGLIDTKACSVSAQLSATRYQKRKP